MCDGGWEVHATCCAPECGSYEDVVELRGDELVRVLFLGAEDAVAGLVFARVEDLPGGA